MNPWKRRLLVLARLVLGAFLIFAGGSPKLPLTVGGFKFKFQIAQHVMPEDQQVIYEGYCPLPVAHTCFFKLTLPAYPTREMMVEKLRLAIKVITFDIA